MKILHVVEPLASGVLTFLVDLTNRQCDDFDVYVAYGIRPLTPLNFKQYFDKRIHWIPVENFKMTLGINDVKAYFELKRIIKEVDPEIVHCHSSISGFLGRMAADCNRRKVFYTPHGYSFLMEDGSRLKRLIYWGIEYMAAKTNSTTIACGKGEYFEARKLSQRSTYVNNGVDVDELQVYVKHESGIAEKPMVCTSGRVLFQKNPKLFNRIAELLPDIQFVWIGQGEMDGELTSPNIRITGWVNRAEALRLTAQADFFLLPSLWEGLSISLLEAMYLKKICLVSNCAGNRNTIINGTNGFICNEAEEYASVISGILSGKIEWESVVEHAHKDVLNEYNTTLLAEKYQRIYEQ